MELQPAISIQGWMIINLLLKRRISAQRWARWYSRSSELCPAPVWWITGVWAAAYVLQTFCDCMCLGRCITDTYPYHSLKFVYAFIGELVSKPDSLSCFLLLLEKRYEGQRKQSTGVLCVAGTKQSATNWAAKLFQLHPDSWEATPRRCMFGPIQHVVAAEEEGRARCAASALLGIPAVCFLLQ